MNYEVVRLPKITVAGPCARTTNQKSEKIGELWQALFTIQPDRGETYGVYTNYQGGVDGEYDAVAARKYCPGDPLPDGFQVVEIPAGSYAKFSFRGDPARDVGGFWKQIWAEPIPRRFACDFERYVGESPDGMEIEIYVGIPDFCQSCGMPMQKEEDYGTETDGSRSEDYCVYCYKDGKFLADCTMEQMVDFCLKIGEDAGRYPDREQAKQQMLTYFPTLKRWKTEK